MNMQEDDQYPDENAVPAPLDDQSEVDSRNLTDMEEDGDEVQQGSDDEGEDLMDNLSG